MVSSDSDDIGHETRSCCFSSLCRFSSQNLPALIKWVHIIHPDLFASKSIYLSARSKTLTADVHLTLPRSSQIMSKY